MEYASIPDTPLEPSRVAVGTWAIGGAMWGGSDREQSLRAIHEALDQGVTMIDTAPIYGFGHAEEIVGEALASSPHRHRTLVATKAGLAWSHEGIWRDASPERLQREVEDSLRRLGVEAIDLYQIHWPDHATSSGETAAKLDELVAQGKIRAIGVSNYAPEEMDRFRTAVPLHTAQPPYNLFERGIEDDILPYCRDHGIATLTYGALCRGLLSGRMTPETTFEGDDLRKHADPKFQPPRFEQYLAAVDALDRFARTNYGRSVLELAVRWVLDQPGVTVALWGARRPEQLAQLPGVFGWHLDEDALAEIDRLVDEHVRDPVGPEFMAPPDNA